MKLNLEPLSEFLDSKNLNYVSFGYGQIKAAAHRAASLYGIDWASKRPRTLEAVALRAELRQFILSLTPKTHSNKYVVWQRFCQYAIEGQRPRGDASA